MQQYQATGYLGKDAEVRNFNGDEFVTFSIGCSSKKGDAQVTEWVNCSTKQMELRPYLKKGTLVFIQGFPKVKAYIDKHNEPQASQEVYLNMVTLLSSKKQAEVSIED